MKNAITIDRLDDDLIRTATRAFLDHPFGPLVPQFIKDQLVNQALETFTSSLAKGETCIDGCRLGVRDWSHAKWRYKVTEDGGAKWFSFVIQANCSGERDHATIENRCRQIATDLQKKGLPVIMET